MIRTVIIIPNSSFLPLLGKLLWQNFVLYQIHIILLKCILVPNWCIAYTKFNYLAEVTTLFWKLTMEKMRASSPIIIFWSPLFENKCMAYNKKSYAHKKTIDHKTMWFSWYIFCIGNSVLNDLLFIWTLKTEYIE